MDRSLDIPEARLQQLFSETLQSTLNKLAENEGSSIPNMEKIEVNDPFDISLRIDDSLERGGYKNVCWEDCKCFVGNHSAFSEQ
jgi:hypothetical protein